MQVADNLPLYGVCCYMEEIVHRPPTILRSSNARPLAPLSRYLVSAPRCYCFLTHQPFFSLHFKVGWLRVPCLYPRRACSLITLFIHALEVMCQGLTTPYLASGERRLPLFRICTVQGSVQSLTFSHLAPNAAFVSLSTVNGGY